MTKAAQQRVAAMLRHVWAEKVSIALQADGGLVAFLSNGNGQQTVLVISDETSPILRIITRMYLTS